jgi:uncharacterized protein (DUF2249 family)
MTSFAPLEIDVRPLCAAKRPPLPAILAAVSRLAPGQGLRVIAPFEPAPLYDLLGQRGFSHTASRRPDGAWEVDFKQT